MAPGIPSDGQSLSLSPFEPGVDGVSPVLTDPLSMAIQARTDLRDIVSTLRSESPRCTELPPFSELIQRVAESGCIPKLTLCLRQCVSASTAEDIAVVRVAFGALDWWSREIHDSSYHPRVHGTPPNDVYAGASPQGRQAIWQQFIDCQCALWGLISTQHIGEGGADPRAGVLVDNVSHVAETCLLCLAPRTDKYTVCEYEPPHSFPVDMTTLATCVIEGILATLPPCDNGGKAVGSPTYNKHGLYTVRVGLVVLQFLMIQPGGATYAGDTPTTPEGQTERQRHAVAELMLDSGILLRLAPVFAGESGIRSLYASVVERLGLTGYSYPREVIDLCGLRPLVELSSLTGAPLPLQLEVPLERTKAAVSQACHSMAQMKLGSLSPALATEWAAFMEHVLVHAARDMSVLDDLLDLMDGNSPVFRMCLSEGVARALFHLAPDTTSLTLHPVIIRLAAHIVALDTELVDVIWKRAPDRVQSLVDAEYVPLTCTRALLDSGIIDAIHAWLGTLYSVHRDGGEEESSGRVLDKDTKAIGEACASVLNSLAGTVESRVLVRGTTLVEEWLEQDVKRLNNVGLMTHDPLYLLFGCLGQLNLSGFDHPFAQSEALEILARYPDSDILSEISSVVFDMSKALRVDWLQAW
ncbi:hypothetical protein KIPB_011453 [Kipferlia bialata]|uniref:Uncharacterized protein n=1 Tax=Kipferlia bialata TaxID=797122 RepID=A0A9K3GMB1_9EUKA|nr:hypothetical protein KIPB_011453 [Kipferlia bialata]|eukprot:g11453.t1